MRVLHISLDTVMGGIESFLLNVYKLMDRKKVQFDFIEYGEEERGFDYKFKELGSKIYKIPDRKKHPILARKELELILKKEKYSVVHLHKNSLSEIGALEVCKKVGVPTIILHSHNSSRDNKLLVFLHKFNKARIDLNTIKKFSCSKKAANWLYGSMKDVKIVKNGIQTDRFDFDNEKRNILRNELKINDCIVLGNVGRLTEQKNPLFVLDIITKIKLDNIKLLWVGDGPLHKQMDSRIKKLGLSDKVIMTGTVANPEDYYQVMDIFLMPSKYEGFPIAAVEAQCSGLPVILSNSITDEVILSDNVRMEDVSNETGWVLAIENMVSEMNFRKSNKDVLIQKGFDLKTTVLNLQQFYLMND